MRRAEPDSISREEEMEMKTIRLLYPDHRSGGLDAYYLGAHLLARLLPRNERQPVLRVDLAPPDGAGRAVTDGIYAREEVLDGIRRAAGVIEAARPDRIITIGGSCIVSQAPFDYLHGRYDNLGIVWIDAHPDVSTEQNGYPNAHAMVLGALLGRGSPALSALRKHRPFRADEVLYLGLQGLHGYQERFLNELQVDYRVQTESFLPREEIAAFLDRFDHILIHLDLDVLDARWFHATYFANRDLVGDGSGGGRMTLEELSGLLGWIAGRADVAGFTIAEYLPFEAQRLHDLFAGLPLFRE